MLADIENGEIDTAIVKALSRFGRFNGLVSYYVEIYFPQHFIRFIAVSDNEDSENGYSELMPFKNIFNEWYISVSKPQLKQIAETRTFPCILLINRPTIS